MDFRGAEMERNLHTMKTDPNVYFLLEIGFVFLKNLNPAYAHLIFSAKHLDLINKYLI